MPTHAEQRLLPYRPEQLYELVAGVDRYPGVPALVQGGADHQA